MLPARFIPALKRLQGSVEFVNPGRPCFLKNSQRRFLSAPPFQSETGELPRNRHASEVLVVRRANPRDGRVVDVEGITMDSWYSDLRYY